MSSKYSITPEQAKQEEARQERRTREVKQEIKETIGTTISAKYNEFILLQYQLHCDEHDASNIIVASAKDGPIYDRSFLIHCRERKIHCYNEMQLLEMTYPQLHNARRSWGNQRI